MSKKLVSAALTATTSVWLSGAMLLMPVAHAQDVAALQAQIASLLQTIAALQAQINAATGGSSMMSYTFTRDLTVGSTGDDVKALQQFLNSHGAQVAASGSGAPGSESTYFGSLTKAALAKWQAANGVSPAAGYFGPITRAKVNSMAAPGGPVSGGPSVPPPVSGLAVSLAADSATGSAIAGAGQVKAGKFAFVASASGAVTVTGLEFTKVGVLSDANISNLYLADAMTGEIVAQYQSLTGGLATFSGLNLSVGAGQTWWGELRMDVSSSATAGNTIAWKLSKVTTASGAPVSGSPTTNSLTVTSVSNPSIAAMTLTATAVGSSVDAGTSNVLVSAWTAGVTNSKVKLENMQFTFVGSANPADIKNLVLKVNGVQVATLAQAATNVNFNFASNPVTLNTGNSNIEIFADVMGSPNRTMTFSLLQPYRVSAVDSQYNTGISPTISSGSQTTITINTGSISVSLSSNTPTGNVPIGASNVTLAKFRIYSAGEAVKVKFLDATITKTGGGSWATAPTSTTNIKLIDDAGGQVGNSISSVASGTGSGQCTLAAAAITCHFGTSSSPINYIVPANTSREISLVVDIGSSVDASTLQGSLPGNTDNMEGQTSFVTTLDSGAATGSTLTVVTTPLSVVANTGFSGPTYVAGANDVKIASFVISASSADGARISSLTFDKDDAGAFDIQNMKVMVGSTQFGSTRATLSLTAAETSIAFSGTAIVVPAGGSVTVDVYADILTGSVTTSSVIDLTGWSAIGVTSLSTITFGSAVGGQDITISSGPTLTVAAASETAPSKQVVMGSTGNSLFTLRLTANNVEDIRVTDITLRDNIGSGSTGIASFTNLALYDGTTMVAGPLSATMPGSASSSVAFSLASGGVVVPKNGTKNLELKGDVATFSSGGATSGSTHNWGLLNSTSSVTAYGKDSSASATVSGSPTSNTSTVYRTKVTLSSSLLGSSSGRARTAVDDLATLNFAANSSYQAVLGTVTLKFSGIAVSNGSTAFTVDLIDTNTNLNLGSASQQTCTPGLGNSCLVTFSPQFTIDAGTTKATKVRVNSASFFDASVAGTQSLSVLINGTSDTQIYDGSTAAIPLESTVVPFTVTSVSYE
jgi:hypothetical protein